MKKLEGQERERLTWDRPTLKAELENVADVWQLPAGAGDIRTMESTIMLLARYKRGGCKIVMDTPGRGKDKEGNRKPDKVTTWLFNPEELQEIAPAPEASGDYILIEKSRLGRKRRTLTDEERQDILNRHEKGETIHDIAKALHMGTARISGCIKQGESKNGHEVKKKGD